MKPDLFEAPDYYNLDDLLTDEHKLIRDSAREWVKKSVSPIIEEYAQKAEFPNHLIKELADIGAYGPYVKYQDIFASLGRKFDVLEIGLEQAVELINIKKNKPTNKVKIGRAHV